jgi:hypothetical protein
MGNVRAFVPVLPGAVSLLLALGCSSSSSSGVVAGTDASTAVDGSVHPGTGGSKTGGGTGGGAAAGGSTASGGRAAGSGGLPEGSGGVPSGTGGVTNGSGGAAMDGSVPPDAAAGGGTSSGGSGGTTGSGGGTGSGGTADAGQAPFCPGVFTCINGDGCCAPGCNKLTDTDCRNICGDSKIAANEGCDDGNAVTETCPYGSYGCTVCAHDCTTEPGQTSRCGDGRVDATNGELCDSTTCPAGCSDFDVCTKDTLSGSGCQTVCQHTAIAACASGDGCCPAGCTVGNDTDCGCTPTGPEIADNGLDDDCVGGSLTAASGPGVYVAKGGDDANAGTKAKPKLTIAAALTAAASAGGTPVFVAEGVYTENVTAHTSLFGGYEATGWTYDFALHATELHAKYSAAALDVPTDTARPVVIGGLRVFGGGLSWSCSAVSVEGPGVAALLSRVYVDGGSCDNGYAVDTEAGASTRVVNSIVLGGSGYHTSVALNVEYGKARIEAFHSLLRSRPSQFSYATLSEYDADLLLVNDILDGPSGVDVEYGGRAALYGNDVYHAGAACLASALGCVAPTVAALNACTFTGCQGAASNFSSNPILSGTGAAERLGAGSPCIDVGLDPHAYGVTVPTDIDGQARPHGAKPDVGHDEYLP